MNHLDVCRLGVLEDGDDVAHDGDAHLLQVFLGQVHQHALLDAVVQEHHAVLGGRPRRDARRGEEPDPLGHVWREIGSETTMIRNAKV